MLHSSLTNLFPLAILLLQGLTPVLADYSFSPILPPDSIPANERNDWCNRHVETCNQVCGKGGITDKDGKDIDNLGTKTNTRLYTTLEYLCVCNRTNPKDSGQNMRIKMEMFHFSVPGLMCQSSLDQCKQTFRDDKGKKAECSEKIGSQCGKLWTKQQYTKDRKAAEGWA